jgi:hypothetical protein
MSNNSSSSSTPVDNQTEQQLAAELSAIYQATSSHPADFTLHTFARVVSLIKAIIYQRQASPSDGDDSDAETQQAHTDTLLATALPIFTQHKLRLLGASHLQEPLMLLVQELRDFRMRLQALDASGLVGRPELDVIQAELSVAAKKIAVFRNVVPDLILIPWQWVCLTFVSSR